MRSRWLLNFTLLLGVGLLAGLLLYERPPAPVTRVSNLEPSAFSQVRFQPYQEEAFTLERDPNGWRLTAPLNLAANSVRVESLLAVASAQSLDGFRAAGNDLEQFGLLPPRARLELGREVFEFGDTDPLDGRRYVLHAGQVHLVTDAFFQHLGASAASYVHPAPLGPGAEPTRIVLPTTRVFLRDGSWQSVGTADEDGHPDHPEPSLADHSPDQLGELAARWSAAQAVSVETLRPELPWQSKVQVAIRNHPEPLDFLVLTREYDLLLGRLDTGVQYRLVRSTGDRLLSVPPAPPGSE